MDVVFAVGVIGVGGESSWYAALYLLLVVGGWCSHWSASASVWTLA